MQEPICCLTNPLAIVECSWGEYQTFPTFQSPALLEYVLSQFHVNYPYLKLGVDSFLAVSSTSIVFYKSSSKTDP